ncbi:MAG: hypothetical protein ACLFVU_08395 [Phycisphaerae bacterium]
MKNVLHLLCAAGLLLTVGQVPVRPGRAGAPVRARPKALTPEQLLLKVSQSQLVFKAKVDEVKPIAVTRSYPPVYIVGVTFTQPTVYKGTAPDGMTFRWSRPAVKPAFVKGKEYVVASNQTGKMWVIAAAEPATKENVTIASKGAFLPAGWKLRDSKYLSPWAEKGKTYWPKEAKPQARIECVKTGRPGLLAGENIDVSAEPIIPKKTQKYKNPQGNGLFRLRVKNTGKKAVEIPALLQADGKILWSESLVVLRGDKAYTLPESDCVPKDVRSFSLGAGKSVSVVINALAIKGIDWPGGGRAVQLKFCLGQEIAPGTFHYYSELHDPMQEKAEKQGKSLVNADR